jgi:hypothetical protein
MTAFAFFVFWTLTIAMLLLGRFWYAIAFAALGAMVLCS